MSILQECYRCHKKQSNKNKRCTCGLDLDRAKRSGKIRYWINYRVNGVQKREAVKGQGLNPYSITDAKIMDSKRSVQKRENRILDIKKESNMTFDELTEWYLKLEKIKSKAYFPTIKFNLASFNAVFGQQIVLTIKQVDLENYQEMRKAEGLSDSYIDKHIGAARTMVNKAIDNDMISGDAIRAFKKTDKLLKKNSNARDRIITQDELEKLLEHLPKHGKDILKTAYYTGMRKGEIMNLTWDRVDLQSRFINLEAEDTKDKEKRSIPICDELYSVFHKIPRAIHNDHVFMYRNKPVNDIRNGLRIACGKAGIIYGQLEKNGLTFHDLRHTFVTNMRKAKISESVIMAITGHSTREMFDRYNKIDKEDIKEAVDRLGDFLQSVDQSVDQNEKRT
jgi:integrase